MWLPKLSKFALTVITAVVIVMINLIPSLAQLDYDPFTYDLKFEQLQLYTDPSAPRAPVVIDGREIFSVSKIDDRPAEERVGLIRSELFRAIEDDRFKDVIIEEKNNNRVLKITYQRRKANGEEDEERRYLFTVTQPDTVGQKSVRDTAQDMRAEIKRTIARAKKERSPQYIRRQGAIAIALILLAIFGTRLLDRLQTYPFRQAIQKVIPGLPSNTNSQPSSLTTLIRLKLGFVQLLLWLVTLFVIFRLFPFTRHWLYLIFAIFTNTFNESVFNFGGNEFSILKILFLIVLIFGVVIASNYIADGLRTNVLQMTRMSRGSQDIISTIAKYGLICLATIILLQAYGVNLSSLTLIGSALGVGIGFGLQDIARNFASGIVLMFERSIQVGDFIQVGEHLGIVEEVRTRSIVLKTLDRISIIVPNSRFLSDEVINWNHRKSVSRIHLPIGVAYGSDVRKVKSALLQAAEEHLEVLRNPPPQVFFTEFGDSSLNFELLIWTSDPSRQAPLKSDLCFRIEEIFQEQQIDIPFPQRDINISSGDIPIKLPPQIEGHLLYLLKGLIAKQYDKRK